MHKLSESDKRKLEKVLVIPDLEKESIFGVIGRMEVLIQYFKKNKSLHNLIPFLETYYLISRAVAEKNVERGKFYDNYPKIERLDVYFASLYFKPLKIFLETGRTVKPWQNYFKYCKKRSGVPFFQMLLGINSHINGDLAHALVLSGYEEKKDFSVINRILKEEIPDVMKYLAFEEHDVFGAGGLIFKKLVLEEFRNIVVKWRKSAWENAQVLEIDNTQKLLKKVHKDTEVVASGLVGVVDDLVGLKNMTKLKSQVEGFKVVL